MLRSLIDWYPVTIDDDRDKDKTKKEPIYN